MTSGRIAQIVLAAWLIPSAGAWAQLRIVSWNTASSSGSLNPGTDVVLAAMGAESVNGIARPVDVFVLQEQSAGHGSEAALVSVLNGIYGAGTYAHGTGNPWSGDGLYVGIVYNTNTVQLLEELFFKAGGNSRDSGRYRLRPVGYGPAADIYIYNTHYKAGTGSTDRRRRAEEARVVRWHASYGADALGAEANVIYAGDYNMRSSSEDALMSSYDTSRDNPYSYILTAQAPWGSSGNGRGADPVGRPGYWHDNSAYKDIHTQNPSYNFVGGGMDDRFDMQLLCTDLLDGEGVSYIGPAVGDIPAATHSYRPFGNNGTHPLNGKISQGTGASPAVLAALETASDHLPLVADYQLPARMSVSVAAVPSQLIVGAPATMSVTVSNSADVVAAIGADELDYSLWTTGSLSGSATGTDPALGGGNQHWLTLQTGSPGAKAGELHVASSSQAVADGQFDRTVNYQVLDHAEASFAAEADLDALAVDFGTVRQGRSAEAHFCVHNLTTTPGFTAALDLDAIEGTGQTTRLTTNLAPFADLPAGQSRQFTASLDAGQPGSFAATYTLSVSDADLPGSAAGTPMTLNLSATVSLFGDVDTDGDQTAADIDADDIDALFDRFGSADMFADLDDSGQVDQADADVLVLEVLGTAYGDANLDGQVGIADLGAVADSYGLSAGVGWASGDFNGDEMVGIADLGVVADNYGYSAGGGPAVPEPAAGALCLLGLLAAAGRRRRRWRSAVPRPAVERATRP